jgi:ABC-type nitrate/sulfonate/bicarbonate transport system permease component
MWLRSSGLGTPMVKLAERGLGFLTIHAYMSLDMLGIHALLVVLFALAILANTTIGRFARFDAIVRR